MEAICKSNIKTRLIAPSAHHEWSAGAIGIGLSHRLCWRICCNNNSPLVVLEDDVVLAEDWHQQLEQKSRYGHTGWNLDSMLRSEFSNQQEMINLNLHTLKTNYSNRKHETRQLKKLRNSLATGKSSDGTEYYSIKRAT